MSTRGLSSDEARMRAQRTAAKAEQRRQEAASALEAQRAEQQAVAEKTARLRALRLAKEAAEAKAAAQRKVAAVSPKRSKPPRERANAAVDRMDVAMAKLGRRGRPDRPE